MGGYVLRGGRDFTNQRDLFSNQACGPYLISSGRLILTEGPRGPAKALQHPHLTVLSKYGGYVTHLGSLGRIVCVEGA